MDVRVKELLPIGSVVRLENAQKSLMVFGVRQTDMRTNIEYVYIGVVYPEGNLGQETQLFFNHDSIETIYFRGYEDEEREKFLNKLEEYYASNN